MDKKNKKKWVFHIKCIFLLLWGMLTIATFAGVLNYCPESFVRLCTGLLLAVNGACIYIAGRKITKENEQ